MCVCVICVCDCRSVCPSGLRGYVQVVMFSNAWVQIPQLTYLFTLIRTHRAHHPRTHKHKRSIQSTPHITSATATISAGASAQAQHSGSLSTRLCAERARTWHAKPYHSAFQPRTSNARQLAVGHTHTHIHTPYPAVHTHMLCTTLLQAFGRALSVRSVCSHVSMNHRFVIVCLCLASGANCQRCVTVAPVVAAATSTMHHGRNTKHHAPRGTLHYANRQSRVFVCMCRV